ncbi:MAG: dihydrolipoyl dehydrogenase [Chloroflexi bacterium]|nr:dihydrolipoyl dehydrogenase [Chloroflexota bacterium]MDA1239357.1 dihydrolipoyl dehydrogenase [Chloroflexota bacterium]
MTTDRIRLAVLGAGPGGYPAAFLAAERGWDVTLIDPRANPGGVCLYVGCIPSKALLHAAHTVRLAEDAEAFGIAFGEPAIDLDRLRGWKDDVVEKITGGLGTLAQARRVRSVRGMGRFVDGHTIRVASGGELVEVNFDVAIIATGSSPVVPPPLRLDSNRVWDSTAALELREVPETLLIVGGGYIGLEMATLYSALGSHVTVVEMTGTLLAGADEDLVRVLSRSIEDRIHEVLLDTRVTALREHANGGVEADLADAEQEVTRTFDRVLIAVGRRPNSADLGLEHTGVSINERGFIVVDHQRRTTDASIYAVGDVAGEPMLAHKATHEARVAVEAIAGEPASWDPAAIPAVVYTDPEVAWCGLTEQDARARNIEVQVARFPWTASGRAVALGRTDGVTKVVVEPGTERVLGMGIAGPGAGELIAEAVLAVEMGARLDDLRMSIHPHPSLTETVMEAADVFFNTSPHYIARRR